LGSGLGSTQQKDLTQIPIAPKDDTTSQRWAVVVGVSEYKPGIRKLSFAADDAQSFANALNASCGVPRDHIKLLTDERATSDAVRSALGTWLSKAAGPEDTVFVYFSGHGYAEEEDSLSPGTARTYLVTSNTTLEDLVSTSIPIEEVSVLLSRIRAQKALVLIDSCFSGGATGSGSSIGRGVTRAKSIGAGTNGSVLRMATAGSGRAVITACEADEISYEYSDLKHGLFTHFLIKGLSGEARVGANPITPNELYGYLSKNVLAESLKRQHKQTVTALAKYSGPPFSLSADTSGPQSGSATVHLVSSPLGADVFIDGENKPYKTPCNVSLKPGPRRLLFSKPGYIVATEEIYASPGKSSVSVVLQATPNLGNLLVAADKTLSGATVELDGVNKGVISNGVLPIFDLAAKSYQVSVSALNRITQTKTVNIEPGIWARLDFKLESAMPGRRGATEADVPAGLKQDGDDYTWTRDGSQMVFVSSGQFKMGDDDTPEASPKHEADTGSYWIDKCEVTNGQFAKFVSAAGYKVTGTWKQPASSSDETLPATSVSLVDARAYAAWCGKRLPTEAEWEKAARGTNGQRFPYGNDFSASAQNVRSTGIFKPVAVGTFSEASPYGALDMLGNVAEWCDTVFTLYPGSKMTLTGSSETYAIRGCSFSSPPLLADVSVWYRSRLPMTHSSADTGFRCVVDARK
jgi:formylglycine-generating enzyme required for sulfatase activity/uncharacterized caspase-like protein